MDLIKNSFENVCRKAHQDGAEVELLMVGGESLKIGFQKKKLDSFNSSQTQMAGLRVILGASQGYAYTENLSEEALLRTYQEALNNARTVNRSSDRSVSLVTSQDTMSMPEVYVDEEIAMDEKLQVARLLEEVSLNEDSRIQGVPYSGFQEVKTFKRVLNSKGLDRNFQQSYYSGYAYSLAKTEEFSKMDGEGFFERNFKNIDAVAVAKKSVQKALSRLGAQKLKTGNYAVVIDRDQFPMILNMLESYFSAKEVDEGKSLFAGKLGSKIGSEVFNLIDDPFNMQGTAVRPFDDEGASSQRTVLFEKGVLKNLLTNSEYAAKMNLPHTAHAARSPTSTLQIAATNLVVEKGEQTLAELLKGYETVIHLTEFSGGLHAGFKSATGDFSMPAEGFLYHKGVLQHPVDQFVVSGNVLELLAKIQAVGNEYGTPGSSMLSPDVLISSLSFAGG